MPRMLLGIPERRRNMRSNAQLVKDGLTITRYWLARSASSAVALMSVATRRRCPHFRRVDTADWPSTSGDIFRSSPGSRKSLSRHTFRSTSPAREALVSMSTAPSWVAARLAPSAGLVVVQASRWAMRIQRMKTMASKQPRKQTKSGAKADTGEANKPARNRQRAPRRRVSQARSGSAPTETSSAAAQAGAAPQGASDSVNLSKNTTRSPGKSSQSKLPGEGADLPTANVPGADADR